MHLHIASSPERYFSIDSRAFATLPQGSARHALLLSVSELRSEISGENANLAANLRNSSAEASALFAYPPIGCVATVYEGSTVLFTGIVQGMQLTDTAVVELEA